MLTIPSEINKKFNTLMILIDYFIYKVYSLTKKYFYSDLGYYLFALSLFINIDSILVLYGYPIWEKSIRYILLASMILVVILLFYVYGKRGRLIKVVDKYKNENTFWKIFGWIMIFGYFIITIILFEYSHTVIY